MTFIVEKTPSNHSSYAAFDKWPRHPTHFLLLYSGPDVMLDRASIVLTRHPLDRIASSYYDKCFKDYPRYDPFRRHVVSEFEREEGESEYLKLIPGYNNGSLGVVIPT